METKYAVIVGGSSGIGCECGKILLNRGYAVYNLSRTECPCLGVKNFPMDLFNSDSIISVSERILSAAPSIDVLINSGGFSMAAPFESTLEQDYRYLFDVNFFGQAKIIQRLLPALKANGNARIINVSSLAATAPIPYDPFYSASKAALNSLSAGLSIELKRFGIQVCAVMPGGTQTEFTEKRKVYKATVNTSDYPDIEGAVRTLADIEQQGMMPGAVAEHIFKLIRRKKMPIFSTPGIKNKATATLTKALPAEITAKNVEKKYSV